MKMGAEMMRFNKLLGAVQANIPVQVLTLVETPPAKAEFCGQMLAIQADGRMEGQLVDSQFTNDVLSYINKNQWEKPVLFEFGTGSGYKIFWDMWANARKAVVFGGGHISQPLVEFLARIDFEVTVVDDRLEFANEARFPTASHVICNSFSRALAESNTTIDENTAVVIVTRGHRYDLECLRSLIDTKAKYLGMIGSRRRVEGIRKFLAEEGVATEALRHLRSPIGIDIGATSPAEIALSIAAEIMSVFGAGSLKTLSLNQEDHAHG